MGPTIMSDLLKRHVDFAAEFLARLTISQTQDTHHERLLRLPLVRRRRVAEDPGRGSPLLLRCMPTPLACDLPQARGVRPERLAKFRARFVERGSQLGTEDPAPKTAGLPMTNATSTTPMAASRVSKSAQLDDVEDPKSTEDAVGLLADAGQDCRALRSGPGWAEPIWAGFDPKPTTALAIRPKRDASLSCTGSKGHTPRYGKPIDCFMSIGFTASQGSS